MSLKIKITQKVNNYLGISKFLLLHYCDIIVDIGLCFIEDRLQR